MGPVYVCGNPVPAGCGQVGWIVHPPFADLSASLSRAGF
jgi:hypothetical protein